MQRLGRIASILLLLGLMITVQACGADEAGPQPLPGLEGPSPSFFGLGVEEACNDAGDACDGVIAFPGATGADRGDDPYDDDFDRLVRLIGIVIFESSYEFWDAFHLLSDQTAWIAQKREPRPFGPFFGVINFGEACESGSGTLTVGAREIHYRESTPGGFEFYMPSAGYGSYLLLLSQCSLKGDLVTIVDNTAVSISGWMRIDWWYDYEVGEHASYFGNLTMQPLGVPLTFDGRFDYDQLTDLTTHEGGVCYGGTRASSAEACGGDHLFMDPATALDNLYWWTRWTSPPLSAVHAPTRSPEAVSGFRHALPPSPPGQ